MNEVKHEEYLRLVAMIDQKDAEMGRAVVLSEQMRKAHRWNRRQWFGMGLSWGLVIGDGALLLTGGSAYAAMFLGLAAGVAGLGSFGAGLIAGRRARGD